MIRWGGLALLILAIAGCHKAPKTDADVPSKAFPAAERPVAPIVSARFSTEEARDRVQ